MASHQKAFDRFYRDNLKGVRAYIRRLMPNSPETEDLTQEAFAKVFEATAEGRPVSPNL